MNVESIMTKDVDTCRRQDTLERAAQIMWEDDIGCVPVLESEDSRRIAGMITDRDICMAAYSQGKSLGEIEVGSCMSTDIHACSSSDSIATAEEIMRNAQVRRVPVVDDKQQLIGMISLADLARQAAGRRGKKGAAELTEAEVGDTLGSISQPRQAAH